MKKGLAFIIIIGAILAIYIGLPLFKPTDYPSEATKNPEERLRMALTEKKPIFIEFFADRCPSCVKMKPIISELQKEYGSKIEFILADTDNEGLGLAMDFQVMYIPGYVFIDSEGQQVGNLRSGLMSKIQLEGLLKELL